MYAAEENKDNITVVAPWITDWWKTIALICVSGMGVAFSLWITVGINVVSRAEIESLLAAEREHTLYVINSNTKVIERLEVSLDKLSGLLADLLTLSIETRVKLEAVERYGLGIPKTDPP